MIRRMGATPARETTRASRGCWMSSPTGDDPRAEPADPLVPRQSLGTRRNTCFFRALTNLLVLIGAALVLFFGVYLYLGQRNLAWPYTSGVIVRSEIVNTLPATFDGGRRGSNSYPVIEYDYTVAGARYRSANVYDGIPLPYSVYDRGLVSRFPYGATVNVSVNPENPRHAVLIPGPDLALLVPFLFGAMFLLAGLWLCRRSATSPACRKRTAVSPTATVDPRSQAPPGNA